MKHEFDKHGNVTLILEGDDDKDVVQSFTQQAVHQDHGVLSSILDHFGYAGNGVFMQCEVGLTDAPMFSDEVDHLDDGTVQVRGSVWWYPNYAINAFVEVLLKTGRVTFQKACDPCVANAC